MQPPPQPRPPKQARTHNEQVLISHFQASSVLQRGASMSGAARQQVTSPPLPPCTSPPPRPMRDAPRPRVAPPTHLLPRNVVGHPLESPRPTSPQHSASAQIPSTLAGQYCDSDADVGEAAEALDDGWGGSHVRAFAQIPLTQRPQLQEHGSSTDGDHTHQRVSVDAALVPPGPAMPPVGPQLPTHTFRGALFPAIPGTPARERSSTGPPRTPPPAPAAPLPPALPHGPRPHLPIPSVAPQPHHPPATENVLCPFCCVL